MVLNVPFPHFQVIQKKKKNFDILESCIGRRSC